MHSWMVVPATDDRRWAEAVACGADVVVVDFTDCDGPIIRSKAEDAIRALRPQAKSIYFQITPIGNRPASLSLNALVALSPNGILLTTATAGTDLQQLDVMISAQEALVEMSPGTIRIAAICGDTPEGMLNAASFRGKSARLSALAWSGRDIGVSLGANRLYDDDGTFIPPLQQARSTTLFAAKAAGVTAIDTLSKAESARQFERECRQACDNGFEAKFAMDADQVRIINTIS